MSRICTFCCVAILVGCSGGHVSSSGSSTPPPASLTALQITPGFIAVAAGFSQQFTATGTFSDGSSRVVTTVQWTSSDANVASINSEGIASGIAPGIANIIVQSGNIQASATLTVTNASANLTAIVISPAAATVAVNTAQQFTATGNYNDGSSRDLTSLVTWRSTSTATAIIDSNGLATRVAAGTTTITATLGSVTQSTTLTVSAPTITSIAVTPVNLTLAIGINQQYAVTATYSDGSSQDLISGVTWTSSAPAVAAINNSGLSTTVGPGAAVITAAVGSLTDTTSLTVVPAHLTAISVSPSAASIAVGTSEQFTATGTFDDGSTQLLTSVAWSSSAPNTGVVSSTGLVMGVGVGSSTISAASGSISGSASLTVTSASLVSIAVAPANSSMAVGTTKQFTATGSFSDSTTQDITASVLWSSSSPAVATANNQGVATSIAAGTTTITAASGSVSGSTGLTVTTAQLVSITISPSNPRIAQGTLLKFTASGTFSDGSMASNLSGLVWRSSKPNIASIRSTGIVHGKKSGSVTISATASSITGTTTLTVGTGTLMAVAITPLTVSVPVGSMQPFVATGTFSDGTTQDITLNSHWSSSSATVATVANAPSVAGLATAHATGTAIIGANSGGNTASATLTAQ